MVVVGGVQQTNTLVISWLLHWDNMGTFITSVAPKHLKNRHSIRDKKKHPHIPLERQRTTTNSILPDLSEIVSQEQILNTGMKDTLINE